MAGLVKSVTLFYRKEYESMYENSSAAAKTDEQDVGLDADSIRKRLQSL